MTAKGRIAIVWLLIAFSQYACDDTASWPEQKFVAKEWINAPEEKRYVFAKDLLDRRILIGMSLDNAKLLLGPPSSQIPEEGIVEYTLAVGGGHWFNQVFSLDIKYNQNTKIIWKAFVRGN